MTRHFAPYNHAFHFKYDAVIANRLNKYTRARLGLLSTPHGDIETPAFIFCGTKGSVKGLHVDQLHNENTQVILANTYHMMLQPGEEIVHNHGGLHKFTGWNKPMMTDSGGFQIFSLGHGSVASEIKSSNTKREKSLVKITKNGAQFRSYINGDRYVLTPEKSMEIQEKLGADLCFAFDECTPFHVSKEYTEKSMHLSHEWEKRSLEHFFFLQERRAERREAYQEEWDIRANYCLPQCLYGIVQGGVYENLRKESANFVSSNKFFGSAIGGSLGGSVEQMHSIIDMTSKILHKNAPQRPIHLLGIGKITDILHGVLCGIDTFDCVHPTRIARHGCALLGIQSPINSIQDMYTLSVQSEKEHINLLNSSFKNDTKPIVYDCQCSTCKVYSRSYIHHLLKAGEMLAYTALTIHNVYTMNDVMTKIRNCLKKCR